MNEIQLLIEAIEDDINRDNGVLKDNFLLKTFVKGFEKVFTVKGDVARVRDVKGGRKGEGCGLSGQQYRCDHDRPKT